LFALPPRVLAVPRLVHVLSAILLTMSSAWAARPIADVPQVVFPPVDVERLLAEDAGRKDGGPMRFAEPILVAITPETDGAWDVEPDGTRSWQLRIRVPAATDINLGFTRFDIPEGASLEILAEDVDQAVGPYSRSAAVEGELWTPALAGDSVLVWLSVPAGAPDPSLELGQIGAGYRNFAHDPRLPPVPSSGACNIDVACPEGDPWRDEIDSVAMVSIGGVDECSGSLIMDVPRTFRPWFLTANHCGIDATNDQTVVTYWNYQAATCRGPRVADPYAQAVTGSTFKARRSDVDFCLIELSSTPPAAFHPYWGGWDRSDVPPSGSVTIHHPSVDEKAISFNDDPLTYRNSCIGGGINTHWNVDNYELGTTEGGSSGSGLLSVDNHRIVGWLSGGAALCSVIDFDCYGRFAVGWDGPSSAQRLRDWLDPGGVNPAGVDGARPGATISFDSVFVSDACAAGGAGDGNGALDSGDTATLVITLVANTSFTNVQGTLSTTTPGVAITNRVASWPDLAPGGPAVSQAPHFAIRPGQAIACGDRLDFVLTVTAAGGGPFNLPFSVDMAPPATCVPCLAPCVVEEIASGPPEGALRVRKGVGGNVVLSFPQTTWCGGAIQVRMSSAARPAVLPGSWPIDPLFANITAQDTDAGPDFVHDPPNDNRYYLIVETESGGSAGPSGSY
jgi:hypothetical protein